MTSAYDDAAAAIRKLAEDVAQTVADERKRLSEGLKIPSPLTAAAEGGSLFNGTRPYTYLTKEGFARIADVDAILPWSGDARKHLSPKIRRDSIERVLGKVVETPEADVRQALVEVVKRLEAVLQEYVFLFPLDNVKLPDGCNIRIGRAQLRLLDGDWKRFCGQTYAAVENLKRSQEDKGAILANSLIHEEELREKDPVLEVRAWGSPESSYLTARDEAHFALAVLKVVFPQPFDEKGHHAIALKGENQERRRGWRLRFATDNVGPSMWSDGTGPGLSFAIPPQDEWTDREKEFIDSLNLLLDSEPRSDVTKRLVTGLFWAGAALIQPLLTREGVEPEPGSKPVGVEVGRRIRDLVTATAAVFKRPWPVEKSDAKAMERLERIVEALDAAWHGQHWPSIEAAYKARHEWAHEGVGSEERVGAEAMAAALREVMERLVIEAAKDKITNVDQLIDWRPPKGGGAQ